MFSLGKISIDKALLLAPMENITDVTFRLICKEIGADVVYTEFVNSEGLIRGNAKTHKKLKITDAERPIGIQIYGGNLDSMLGAARIAEEENPELIDINAGCWVKNVVGCGAGAALLKDPDYLQKMVAEVVKAVSTPVTVKTRIGWDADSIYIVDIAKRLEDVGIKGLTIHCRTRTQAHKGEPDWSWVEKVKNAVSIPVALNGGVLSAEDAKRAFEQTGADAVMIARGAIDNPWIFKQTRELLENGIISTEVTPFSRIDTCLKHLQLSLRMKEEKRAVKEHRKFYTGYLKGLRNASSIRNRLMHIETFKEVEELFEEYLQSYQTEHDFK